MPPASAVPANAPAAPPSALRASISGNNAASISALQKRWAPPAAVDAGMSDAHRREPVLRHLRRDLIGHIDQPRFQEARLEPLGEQRITGIAVDFVRQRRLQVYERGRNRGLLARHNG